MRRIVEEAGLFLLGAALGVALFSFSNLFSYDPNGCGGCLASGWPWTWYIRATGFDSYNPPMEPQYGMDLVSWAAVGYVVIRAIGPMVVLRWNRHIRPEGPPAEAGVFFGPESTLRFRDRTDESRKRESTLSRLPSSRLGP